MQCIILQTKFDFKFALEEFLKHTNSFSFSITFLDFYYNTNVKYHTGYNKHKLSYG